MKYIFLFLNFLSCIIIPGGTISVCIDPDMVSIPRSRRLMDAQGKEWLKQEHLATTPESQQTEPVVEPNNTQQQGEPDDRV